MPCGIVPTSSPSRRLTRRAFTLVELLVVIGIIAVLISVLLPALSGARRQANLVQCSSNMRQVTMALMTYIQDNKGHLPPAGIPPLPNIYPRGWWWANELVRQNYIRNPSVNVYKKTPSLTTEKQFNRANPFRCPEGVDEDYSQGAAFPQGDYPTDGLNNGFTLLNDSDAAADGFGIPSWYQLNSRVGTTSAGGVQNGTEWPGGTRATPFIWFNTAGTQANPKLLNDQRLNRTISSVRRSAELVMLAEAANPNWHDNAVSVKYPGLYLKKLAARHGKKTANGANAFVNFAFFDGHVGLSPSVDYNTPPAGSTFPEDKFKTGTIFWLGHQF
jgi:prepilin-type N-terminal cleavage/methylation domain-containing protein/prepilin-type processing-associated H-X9-DG protein